MKRVALISTDQQALKDEEHLDTGPLSDALNASGVDSEIAIWHEPRDWSVYDAAIFRSPWDYAERTEEFMEWLQRAEPRVRLINSPDLIRWNLDKRYLRELAEQGVDIVPTTFCENLEQCREALASHGGGSVVVKPNISLGSQNTGLFAATDPAVLELCGRILDVGKVVLVQPAIDAIQDNAERGLLFFNAQHSHTIQKCAILKHGGRVSRRQVHRGDPVGFPERRRGRAREQGPAGDRCDRGGQGLGRGRQHTVVRAHRCGDSAGKSSASPGGGAF